MYEKVYKIVQGVSIAVSGIALLISILDFIAK